jgi:hypothetical protein
LYSSKPSYVFGFHGLDKTIGKQVLNGETELRHSENSYDWLGHGVYFWENNLERAWQYAEQASKRKDSKIRKPFVLGAIIDLGNCLDLLDQRYLDFLFMAYRELKFALEEQGKELPVNASFSANDFDFKKRELDCAVIRYAIELAKTNGYVAEDNSFYLSNEEFLEGLNENKEDYERFIRYMGTVGVSTKPPVIGSFDSVRSAFWEGEELYPNAGFKTHNHIQLSIINPNCIKGIFLPRELIDLTR